MISALITTKIERTPAILRPTFNELSCCLFCHIGVVYHVGVMNRGWHVGVMNRGCHVGVINRGCHVGVMDGGCHIGVINRGCHVGVVH